MKKSYLERGAAYLASLILLQTLYFKFSGHPDSVYIFTAMGLEPYGRIGLGFLELIAAVLLVIPKTAIWGSLLGLGMMAGALGSHLFILGIEVQGDGGVLFLLAVLVFPSCGYVLLRRKKELPFLT